MTRTANTRPTPPPNKANRIRLGVIGLGNRATAILKVMCEADTSVCVAAIIDPAIEQAQDRIRETGIRASAKLMVFDDLSSFLDRDIELDGIVIGTRCHLHTKLAVELADRQIPIFLEKPVAISWEQLDRLREAYAGRDERIVVSFPLRRTPLFSAVLAVIRSGRLGPINQVQAVNYIPYGSVYVDSWYRDYELAGGLWLQKATHDFDYIHELAGGHPIAVSAMHTQAAWRPPVLNQDAGSALVRYHHGAHACYSQNFLSRHSAGARGATITGQDATLRFDWSKKEMIVVDHHQDRIDRSVIKSSDSHHGGDEELVKNFLQVIRGDAPSLTTLADGLRSAATCLAAREAAHHATVEPIPKRFVHPSLSEDQYVDTAGIEPPIDSLSNTL